jgi:hypothetical protein
MRSVGKVGEVGSWRDVDEEVRFLQHIALRGDGRSLGVRNKARAAGHLLWLQSFCHKAPPSTVDHKGETTAIHNDCNDTCLAKPWAVKLRSLTEYRDNPCSDKRVCVYKLANTLFVPV